MTLGESARLAEIFMDLELLDPVHPLEARKPIKWDLRGASYKLDKVGFLFLGKFEENFPEPPYLLLVLLVVH